MTDISKDEIRTTLAQLLVDELHWEGDLPTGELAGALDSVGLLTLVVAIEDHFAICFDEADEQAITTVEQLVDIVQERVRAS